VEETTPSGEKNISKEWREASRRGLCQAKTVISCFICLPLYFVNAYIFSSVNDLSTPIFCQCLYFFQHLCYVNTFILPTPIFFMHSYCRRLYIADAYIFSCAHIVDTCLDHADPFFIPSPFPALEQNQRMQKGLPTPWRGLHVHNNIICMHISIRTCA
jgi:hypothetical protein